MICRLATGDNGWKSEMTTNRTLSRRYALITGLVLALLLRAAPAAADNFVLAGQSVAPAAAASFFAEVGTQRVPITVLHGAEPGPVLVLTAGIHGDEFVSILALQRLRDEVDPASLRGTVVLVHLANLAGFHARRIALSPLDEKNLNRVFPGAPDGTPTEQLADFFTREIVANTDFLIDLHSGSANQELLEHVYAPYVGDPELDAATLAFARATGMQHVVLYGERPRDPLNSISYPNTAMTRGKPGLTVEIGHLGQRDEHWVEAMLEVCRRALYHLAMLEGAAPTHREVVEYPRLTGVASPATGLFFPLTSLGATVQAGDVVGEVKDYFGNTLARLQAPEAGIVLMLRYTPPTEEGDTPVTLGIVE